VDSDDYSHAHDNVAVRANLTELQRRIAWLTNTRTSTFFDTNLDLPFKTGFIGHKLIVGVGGGRDTAHLVRNRFFNGPATGPQSLDISIYSPVYGVAPPPESLPLGNLTDRYNVNSAVGVYAADLMTLSEHWKLNLGARASNENQTISNLMTGAAATEKKDKKVLPMIGLLYQPTGAWTVYTSYSTSFVPAAATAQDVSGNNPFKPEFAEQFEVGAKADLLDDRLQPTLSVFTIKKRDVVTSFTCPPNVPASGTCSVQIGAQRSQGAEFEINTRPIEHLQLVAGIAHFNAKILESLDPAQVGARLQNSARDNVHIWSRYDVTRGALAGFGAALGISYTGERAGNLPTSADRRVIVLPGYTVADLGLYYTVKSYDFALKVSNLLNESYLESSGVTPEVQLQVGAPRQVALTMRAHF